MKNIDKYEHSVKSALAAYNDDMSALYEVQLDGCSFEDWCEREEGVTAKEAEKEAVRQSDRGVEDEEAQIRGEDGRREG